MEGVCGFKCFLTHSGVDEFPCVNRAEVEAALAELKVCQSSQIFPLMVKFEDGKNNASFFSHLWLLDFYSARAQDGPQEMERN